MLKVLKGLRNLKGLSVNVLLIVAAIALVAGFSASYVKRGERIDELKTERQKLREEGKVCADSNSKLVSDVEQYKAVLTETQKSCKDAVVELKKLKDYTDKLESGHYCVKRLWWGKKELVKCDCDEEF